jgi:dienelactone hydrolase
MPTVQASRTSDYGIVAVLHSVIVSCWPAAYWHDLRGYDPVGAATALDKPMLILQGGRDYQVTVEDDLARWRSGLADRPNVTIQVHDADNHLFFPSTNQSTPADYPAQHVDPAVIDDIARWLAPARDSSPGSGSSKNRAT